MGLPGAANYPAAMLMVHPGLPAGWAALVLATMAGVALWALWRPWARNAVGGRQVSLAALPWVGSRIAAVARTWQWLVALRIFVAAVFLLVIYAGLFGTPIAERNLATTLTWTVWWTGIIVSVYFVGSAWCAACPWDALANWIVRLRLRRRGDERNRLQLRVPKLIRNTYPALIMFVGLTWLELGFGVTTSPYLTAVIALAMVVLATASLAVFERKAFCRYFCSVGRTLGFYSELAPVALRPIDPAICADCKTLECYHGTKEVEPCPTHLVMGRLKQNTYCTSCGACSQSCPYHNVAWRLRPTGQEALAPARRRWDEGWFVLSLVALTSFHGITMLPFWEPAIRKLAYWIGDSGQLLWSFSLAMAATMAVPLLLFALVVAAARRWGRLEIEYRRAFATLSLAALPLAFAYHLAHNLSHLSRETRGLGSVLLNPLGVGAQPLSQAEMQARHLQPMVHQELIFALQAGLLLFGFWLAVRILRARLSGLGAMSRRGAIGAMTPVLVFVIVVTVFNLWLLMQPMTMRM